MEKIIEEGLMPRLSVVTVNKKSRKRNQKKTVTVARWLIAKLPWKCLAGWVVGDFKLL